MLKFYADKFVKLNRKLKWEDDIGVVLTIARLKVELESRNIKLDPPLKGGTASIHDGELLSGYLAELHELCKPLCLEGFLRLIEMMQEKLESKRYSYDNFKEDFLHTQRSIEIDISKQLCFMVEQNKAEYFDNEKAFGEKVFESFPSARKEIAETGKAFAFGLDTACVFHCMRVVEIGLKVMYFEMTRRTTVTINNKKRSKYKPISLCDWQQIIGALESAKKQIEVGSSISEKKKRNLAFYSDAISTFKLFKDAWRNTISHNHDIEKDRKLFFSGETEDILKRTEKFMQHLAKRIKEKE